MRSGIIIPSVVVAGLVVFISCNASRHHSKDTRTSTLASKVSYPVISLATEQDDPANWPAFKAGFKRASLPLIFNEEAQAKVSEDDKIPYSFQNFASELKSGAFCRRGPVPGYFFALVDDNPRFTTVVYAIQQRITSVHAPYRFKLATYDNTGKLLNKMNIAGQSYADEPELTCTISPDLVIELKTLKHIYKKDVKTYGYEDNEIERKELVSTRQFRINAAGIFEQTSGDVAVN